MRNISWTLGMTLMLFGGALAQQAKSPATPPTPAQAPPPAGVRHPEIKPEANPNIKPNPLPAAQPQLIASSYWIGVEPFPAGPALQTQLGLSDHQGRWWRWSAPVARRRKRA